jgi:hypothetical protein
VPASGTNGGFFNTGVSGGIQQWTTLDIDGDGRPDLVQTGDPAHASTVFGNTTAPYWQVYKNTGTGFAASPTMWAVPASGTTDGFYAANQDLGNQAWFVEDMNGDGKPDLVQTGDPAQSGKVFGASSAAYWQVYLNTGSAFAMASTMWAVPTSGTPNGFHDGYNDDPNESWDTFDIDGDGKPDLVQAGDPAQSSKVFGATTAPYWLVYKNTGTGFASTATMWAVPMSGSFGGFHNTYAVTSDEQWAVLDMNDDGKPDLVQTADPAQAYTAFDATTAPYWKVYLNNGNGFAATSTTWMVPSSGSVGGFYGVDVNLSGKYFGAFDIDGDGKIEIVQETDPAQSQAAFDATTSSPYWKVYTTSGNGFSMAADTWPLPISGTTGGFYAVGDGIGTQQWELFDIDGDGHKDLVQTGDPAQSSTVFGETSQPYWKVYLAK